MIPIGEIVLGVLLGGIVVGLPCWYFYRQADRALRDEIREIRRLTKLILRAVEQSGMGEIVRDEVGRISRLDIPQSSGSQRARQSRPTAPRRLAAVDDEMDPANR